MLRPKQAPDVLARSYYVTYDLPVLITRSSNNSSPRQHPEKLIPKFITNAQQGDHLPLYGDGSNVREWLYAEDDCRAIETVMTNGTPGEIYNISSGQELTNLEVTKKILEMVDRTEDLIEFVEDRPGHDQRYALDTTKTEALGWKPQWSFEAGLQRTVTHYLDNSKF